MIKLSGILFFILLMYICLEQFVATETYFGPVQQEAWYFLNPPLAKTAPPLLNMTTRLLRDMEQKLLQSIHIKDMYKDNPTFDLGSIVSTLQDLFKHMLEMYKVFADFSIYYKGTEAYTLDRLLDGYHSIQGAYNQIRLEKDLYDQIMKNYLAKIDREAKYKQSFGGSPGMTIKEFKDKIREEKEKATMKEHLLRRFATKQLPEPFSTSSTRKRLWEFKPQWFSEDARLEYE